MKRAGEIHRFTRSQLIVNWCKWIIFSFSLIYVLVYFYFRLYSWKSYFLKLLCYDINIIFASILVESYMKCIYSFLQKCIKWVSLPDFNYFSITYVFCLKTFYFVGSEWLCQPQFAINFFFFTVAIINTVNNYHTQRKCIYAKFIS